MIDTNVVIALANGRTSLFARVAALDDRPLLSVISRVEIEGGAYAEADARENLAAVLDEVEELPFTSLEVDAYAAMIKRHGFSRRLIIDRMIAAQAIVAGAALATLNPRDFRDVHGLTMLDWTA